MAYIDIFQALFIVLFVGGYSILALILIGRAILNSAAAVVRVPTASRLARSRH